MVTGGRARSMPRLQCGREFLLAGLPFAISQSHDVVFSLSIYLCALSEILALILHMMAMATASLGGGVWPGGVPFLPSGGMGMRSLQSSLAYLLAGLPSPLAVGAIIAGLPHYLASAPPVP